LAPSESTLIACVYLLQGQEARRDADEFLNPSIETPDGLKSVVGGQSDRSVGHILGAKVAMACA